MNNRPEVVLQKNSIAQLRGRLDQWGARHILLLCGPSRRFIDRIIPLLEGLKVDVFDQAKAHVPRVIVNEARKLLESKTVDTLISVGGGSATGLGKALRLNAKLNFVAIPTTYAGSEMTAIYGITDRDTKQTGRDENARPDLVLYDPQFSVGMPKNLTTTSLLNALAHPISALSTGSLAAELREDAKSAIKIIYLALEQLTEAPSDKVARMSALEGARLAAGIVDKGKFGIHHELVHFIGGRFQVEHSGLHSVLLPQFVRSLFENDKVLYEDIAAVLERNDIPARLFDFLRRADAATSLKQLGISKEAFKGAMSERADLAVPWVFDALLGKEPSTVASGGV